MPTAPANPDLLQYRYVWQNRVQQWRAQTAESGFAATAATLFIAFALWIVDPQWAPLLRDGAAWAAPLPAALAGLALASILIWRAHAHRRALASGAREDWLAALPIAPTLRQQARRLRAAAASAWMALGIISVLAWAALRAGHPAITLLAALTAGALTGAVVVWFLAEPAPAPPAMTQQRATAVRIAPGTDGLALLGAALEPAIARLPRSAPWVAGGFMLLPPSTPVIALPALILLATSASLALDLIAHWRTRYLADQAWLAAQPLPPARLLGAYLAPLAKRGSLLALVFGACLHALGAPALFSGLLALALWLLLADGVLCAFATRLVPWRFPLLLMLHATALVASAQVLPPALPLVLLACGISAWRRGLR